MTPSCNRKRIISIDVNVTDVSSASKQIIDWATQDICRYICVSNVHMCMEAFDDSTYATVINDADMVVPDGRPLVWAQRIMGENAAKQVRGYNLTKSVCEYAEVNDIAVGFYGGSANALESTVSAVQSEFRNIRILYHYSPPFRALTEEERDSILSEINKSGIKILFVGLGCPKQEKWMAENRTQLHCVMLGIGAVFDFISGNKYQAPIWVQLCGLEWIFRLACEPRRLWKRYTYHNPRFVWHLLRSLIRSIMQCPGKK